MLFLFIVPIDVAWIFDEMRNHPENERDADMVFWFGVFVRTFLFNMVLIPVSIAGLKLRARSRRTPIEMKIA